MSASGPDPPSANNVLSSCLRWWLGVLRRILKDLTRDSRGAGVGGDGGLTARKHFQNEEEGRSDEATLEAVTEAEAEVFLYEDVDQATSSSSSSSSSSPTSSSAAAQATSSTIGRLLSLQSTEAPTSPNVGAVPASTMANDNSSSGNVDAVPGGGEDRGGPSNWPDLNLTLLDWTLLLCGVVACWILISFLLAYFLGPDYVTCYLCEKQIPRRYWLNGEHRQECAKRNEEFLDKLPASEASIRCPVCYRPFRIWPKDLGGNEFTCSGPLRCNELTSDGTSKKPVANTGDNRYNCYNCDIDFCLTCAVDQKKKFFGGGGLGRFASQDESEETGKTGGGGGGRAKKQLLARSNKVGDADGGGASTSATTGEAVAMTVGSVGGGAAVWTITDEHIAYSAGVGGGGSPAVPSPSQRTEPPKQNSRRKSSGPPPPPPPRVAAALAEMEQESSKL